MRLCRGSNPKPVIRRLAEQLGVHPEALRTWIRQDEADRGERDDNRRLRQENLDPLWICVPARPAGTGKPAPPPSAVTLAEAARLGGILETTRLHGS